MQVNSCKLTSYVKVNISPRHALFKFHDMMSISKAQMQECQVNIINSTIVYINFSAFSKMAIYKLHLAAFYAVNECKLIDPSESIHKMKI